MNILCDDLLNLVGIFPLNGAELLVKRLDNVRQVIELRIGLVAASVGWYRLDLRVCVRQRDLDGGLLLDSITVHIDRFEQAF